MYVSFFLNRIIVRKLVFKVSALLDTAPWRSAGSLGLMVVFSIGSDFTIYGVIVCGGSTLR